MVSAAVMTVAAVYGGSPQRRHQARRQKWRWQAGIWRQRQQDQGERRSISGTGKISLSGLWQQAARLRSNGICKGVGIAQSARQSKHTAQQQHPVSIRLRGRGSGAAATRSGTGGISQTLSGTGGNRLGSDISGQKRSGAT